MAKNHYYAEYGGKIVGTMTSSRSDYKFACVTVWSDGARVYGWSGSHAGTQQIARRLAPGTKFAIVEAKVSPTKIVLEGESAGRAGPTQRSKLDYAARAAANEFGE